MLKQKQKAGAFLLSPRRCQGGFFIFLGGRFSCDLSNTHSKQRAHRATLKSEAEHRIRQKRHLSAAQPEEKQDGETFPLSPHFCSLSDWNASEERYEEFTYIHST